MLHHVSVNTQSGEGIRQANQAVCTVCMSLPLSSALGFRPLRPFGCSLVSGGVDYTDSVLVFFGCVIPTVPKL